ncbi:hypothetical protein SAMN05216486_11038 [bacterium JGI 053]|nr:hypothetical protein SAMN05216486_11038 [bacterium JGI 053]
MPRYYYGAVPALAWILSHYFYGGVHYNWLAAEFFPLETNPKSSIPYHVYGDLYWAWSRDDPHDKHLRGMRDSLRLGVTARLPPGISDLTLVRRLRRICRRAAVTWFYPVVYRVDSECIPAGRRFAAGSAVTGSSEMLVRDLAESEFDLLFADNAGDPGFRRLVLDEVYGTARTSSAEALLVLERRLLPWVKR